MSELVCAGCTACCRGELVVLQPEENADRYATQTIRVPPFGLLERVLATKPNGDCVYLEETGCAIYADRPLMCRAFDCRGMVAAMSAAERQVMIERGQVAPAVVEAGLARLGTLDRAARRRGQRRAEKHA